MSFQYLMMNSSLRVFYSSRFWLVRQSWVFRRLISLMFSWRPSFTLRRDQSLICWSLMMAVLTWLVFQKSRVLRRRYQFIQDIFFLRTSKSYLNYWYFLPRAISAIEEGSCLVSPSSSLLSFSSQLLAWFLCSSQVIKVFCFYFSFSSQIPSSSCLSFKSSSSFSLILLTSTFLNSIASNCLFSSPSWASYLGMFFLASSTFACNSPLSISNNSISDFSFSFLSSPLARIILSLSISLRQLSCISLLLLCSLSTSASLEATSCLSSSSWGILILECYFCRSISLYWYEGGARLAKEENFLGIQQMGWQGCWLMVEPTGQRGSRDTGCLSGVWYLRLRFIFKQLVVTPQQTLTALITTPFDYNYRVVAPMSDTEIIKPLVNLLAKTSGRDKVFRAIQYFCRFLARAKRDQAQPLVIKPLKAEILESAGKYQNISRATMITRKILRFGRLIQIFTTIKEGVRKIRGGEVENVPKEIFRLLSELGLGFFFFFDHIEFLQYVGWLNSEKLSQIGFYSDISWLFQCIFCLIYLKFHFEDIINNKAISFTEKKRIKKSIKLSAIKNVLDILMVIGFLRPGGVIGDKSIGILGTLGALIGVYENWN